MDGKKRDHAEEEQHFPAKRTAKLPAELTLKSIDTGFIPIVSVTDPFNEVFPYNIGNSLWSASLELIEYLKSETTIAATSVAEIGAGTGSIGLTAWRRGCARVTLTDLEEMIPILNANIVHNEGCESVSAIALDWTDGGESAEVVFQSRGPFDLIVGAEVTYDSKLHGPLLDTLEILCGVPALPAKLSRGETESVERSNQVRPSRILLAIPLRDDDPEIVDLAEERGFACKEMHVYPPNNDHASPVAIYELTPPASASRRAKTEKERPRAT